MPDDSVPGEPEFVFPPGTPEDFQEQYKNHVHHQQLEVTAAQHELFSFFDSLDEDELRIFIRFLFAIANASSPKRSLAYYTGALEHLRQQKYNICMVCDKDHSKELLEDHAAD